MVSSELQECGRPVLLPAERSQRVCACFFVSANLTLVAGSSFAQTRDYWECQSVCLKTEELFKEEKKKKPEQQ